MFMSHNHGCLLQKKERHDRNYGCLILGNNSQNTPEKPEKDKRKPSFFVCDQSGFTLMELMIVITIIGILSATGIMNYAIARDKARVTTCKMTLDAFKKGLEGYASENDHYPEPQNINTLDELAVAVEDFLQMTKTTACSNDIVYNSDGGTYHLEAKVFYSGGGDNIGVKLILEDSEMYEEAL